VRTPKRPLLVALPGPVVRAQVVETGETVRIDWPANVSRCFTRPRGVESAKVIQVIVTEALVGSRIGPDEICRTVRQYWSLDGDLLAESDPAA
jgi:hypothetical protein